VRKLVRRKYKTKKPENFFAQFGTDPAECLKIYQDYKLTPEEANNWVRDRAGAIADEHLAKKLGWKVGDKITINGTIYPVNLELTIRGLFNRLTINDTLFFNSAYVEEAVPWFKGRAGTFVILADSPQHVSTVASAVDDSLSALSRADEDGKRESFPARLYQHVGNVKASSSSVAEPWCSRFCWCRRTPWPCRFASERVKWPC